MRWLLAGDDEASKAALAALAGGADYVVWEDGTGPSEAYARTYARRLRYTRRKGNETLGLERAVRLLAERAQPIRLGKITTADRAWTFILFLTGDGGALVACTDVRRADG
ncbi:hypothetical protein [Streptomyces sp. NPDC101206]|uniref:hypothetical protein n=1 Tax=Streptomyces sp. NPDC101206 TaxID=3366128 RepID=UPI0037FCFFF0